MLSACSIKIIARIIVRSAHLRIVGLIVLFSIIAARMICKKGMTTRRRFIDFRTQR